MDSVVATVSEIVKEKVGYDIAFPHLGIYIKNLVSNFRIGNFTIAFYGVIIAIAMLIAFFVVIRLSKKVGVDEDSLYDIFILVILLGIIGARAYYVIFNWDYYQIRPYEILDIRAGGLAVFGGIILSFIGIAIYSKIKKVDIAKVIDIVAPGLALGQAIGRYGNFFNMEAYGTYTNNIFAMRMRQEYLDPSNIDFEQMLNVVTEDGVNYIQAHPTFFYESILNIILFIILMVLINKFYKFKGQIAATYLIGYGIIRIFVESLRTDSLMIGPFRVSQIVALICVLIGIGVYVFNIVRKNHECTVEIVEEEKEKESEE